MESGHKKSIGNEYPSAGMEFYSPFIFLSVSPLFSLCREIYLGSDANIQLSKEYIMEYVKTPKKKKEQKQEYPPGYQDSDGPMPPNNPRERPPMYA